MHGDVFFHLVSPLIMMFFHLQAAILAGKDRAELEAAEKGNTFHCTARDIGIEVGSGCFVGNVFCNMFAS